MAEKYGKLLGNDDSEKATILQWVFWYVDNLVDDFLNCNLGKLVVFDQLLVNYDILKGSIPNLKSKINRFLERKTNMLKIVFRMN